MFFSRNSPPPCHERGLFPPLDSPLPFENSSKAWGYFLLNIWVLRLHTYILYCFLPTGLFRNNHYLQTLDLTNCSTQLSLCFNLETIRKRNKSILVYKCLNNLVPQYLSDYFSRNHSFHSYNTRRREDIHPSRPKLSLRKRTFRYSGAILFNSLPETYKRTASLEAFKRLMMN